MLSRATVGLGSYVCQKGSRCQERWGLLMGKSSVLFAELRLCFLRPVSSPLIFASQEQDSPAAV